eukprot:3038871-Rhodomonas_salina.2
MDVGQHGVLVSGSRWAGREGLAVAVASTAFKLVPARFSLRGVAYLHWQVRVYLRLRGVAYL